MCCSCWVPGYSLVGYCFIILFFFFIFFLFVFFFFALLATIICLFVDSTLAVSASHSLPCSTPHPPATPLSAPPAGLWQLSLENLLIYPRGAIVWRVLPCRWPRCVPLPPLYLPPSFFFFLRCPDSKQLPSPGCRPARVLLPHIRIYIYKFVATSTSNGAACR